MSRTVAIVFWLMFSLVFQSTNKYSGTSTASAFLVRSIPLATPRAESTVSPSKVSSASSPLLSITSLLGQGKNEGGRPSGPNNTEDEENSQKMTMPVGNLIMLPLLALVGVDLILNIMFLTKRTFEALLLGHVAPSTETWW